MKIEEIEEIEKICDEVLNTFPASVKDYKKGKLSLIGSFTGEVMIRSKRKADPIEIITILKQKLK